VPSLAAALIASIVSYIVDAAIEGFLGMEARIFIGLIDSTIVYVYARRWLINMRDGL
jgi:hypothetical protein